MHEVVNTGVCVFVVMCKSSWPYGCVLDSVSAALCACVNVYVFVYMCTQVCEPSPSLRLCRNAGSVSMPLSVFMCGMCVSVCFRTTGCECVFTIVCVFVTNR